MTTIETATCPRTGATVVVLDSCRLLASGLATLVKSRCTGCSQVQVLHHERALREARLDVLLIGPGWPPERLASVIGEAFDSPSKIRVLVIGAVRPNGIIPPPPARVIQIQEGHHIETLLESVQSLVRAIPEPSCAQIRRSEDERLLGLIRDGLTNKEIAGRLYLAESTIKWRVSRLLRCNGARNRTELIRMSFDGVRGS